METFNLLDNRLISSIDNASKPRSLRDPMKNSFKTLVKATDYINYNRNQVYNNRYSILIPKQYSSLSQLYIKLTVSNGLQASTVESYFATKVFKYIRLRTKNGLTLQTFTPRYLQARIDQLYNPPIYQYLALSMEPDTDFDLGDPTCFVPLFCFFSEDVSTMIDVRNMEQLELELITNDSKESMGLEVDLASIQAELYCLYHDSNSSDKVPQSNLKGSYEIFEEDTITILSGSTSARLLLRCPHPLFSLNLALVDSDSNRTQIKTIKLSFGDRTFLDLDYRINYQNYGSNKAFLENGTFSYFFNKLKERSVDSGLITFDQNMAPVYLDITFDSLGSDYTLYAFEEYRTYFEVVNGMVQLSDDIKGWREGLFQLNSSMSQVKLSG